MTPLTADQLQLVVTAARTLLAHRDAGRHCDPQGIAWAENVVAADILSEIAEEPPKAPPAPCKPGAKPWPFPNGVER